MSDSSFQINIDTFDPSDLGSVGTGGTRVFSSSSSIQTIENQLQVDRRWNAAMSIGNFSRLTETNPDMGQLIFDYANDFSLSNEEFFNQILDLHQINGMSQYVEDFQDVDNSNIEKMRWSSLPQILKDAMITSGYKTRDYRDLESGSGKSFMEKLFGLDFIPDRWRENRFVDDVAAGVGAIGTQAGRPIRWSGRFLWDDVLGGSMENTGQGLRAGLIAQDDTKIWDPTWMNPAKYWGDGGFLDRAQHAETTWSAEEIDKINDTFEDDTQRWLARETLGYGDTTGRIAELVDAEFKDAGIETQGQGYEHIPEWGERFFELYQLNNTEKWSDLYFDIGAGAYGGLAPGSVESLLLKDWNDTYGYGFLNMKPGSAPAQIYSGTLGMTYRIFFDPINIAFMGTSSMGQASVIASKAMLNQTDDMVKLIRLSNAVDETGSSLRLGQRYTTKSYAPDQLAKKKLIGISEGLGLNVGETVKIKDLVRAVRKQAEQVQYGEAITAAGRMGGRATTAQVATALKYGRLSYLVTPQSIRDVLFLRKIKQISSTLDWTARNVSNAFYLNRAIETYERATGSGALVARREVLKALELKYGEKIAKEYDMAHRVLQNTNPGIRRLLQPMQKWHEEQITAGLEGFEGIDSMLNFLQQNLDEVLAHTNQISVRGFKFPTVSARQRHAGRLKVRALDASNKGRKLSAEEMDALLDNAVEIMTRRMDDSVEDLGRAIEQGFEGLGTTELDLILSRLTPEARMLLKEMFGTPDKRTLEHLQTVVGSPSKAIGIDSQAKQRMLTQLIQRYKKTDISLAESKRNDAKVKVITNIIDDIKSNVIEQIKKDFEINEIYSLSTKPDGLGRVARYARAGRHLFTNPLRSYGILLRNARYAPKGGPIALDTVGGYENMMRYFDMGYLAHLPDEVIEYYKIRYLHGTPGERLNITTQFVSDFLGNSGLLTETDSWVETFFRQWVNRLEHAYGVHTADGWNVLDDTSRAVFRSQMADGMLLPDIHQMMKVSRQAGWWRRIGFSPTVEQINVMIGSYWKPAVLMRMGFVFKTAGEEFFSYMLRHGLLDYTATKLGPKGSALYKAYDWQGSGKRIWYDGKNLAQLERYRRASPMKPVIWALNMFGPSKRKLEHVAWGYAKRSMGNKWMTMTEMQKQEEAYKQLQLILNNATDIPLTQQEARHLGGERLQKFRAQKIIATNLIDERTRQAHRWLWDMMGDAFYGRKRSYNSVRRVKDPVTGLYTDAPPEQWVRAKQTTERLSKKIATNLVGPEHVEEIVVAARANMLHPSMQSAYADVMAGTISRAYTGENTAMQVTRQSADAIDGIPPDRVHIKFGYNRYTYDDMPNPADSDVVGDTGVMLNADFPNAVYSLAWRLHDDPASYEGAKVLLNIVTEPANNNARNLITNISGTVPKNVNQSYQMVVRELEYLPFDMQAILKQVHRRSHNGHAWDTGSDLIPPHIAHEGKLASKEERMRKAMSERDYKEARRIGEEVPSGHEWNWLDDLSQEEFEVYERINYILSQATDWDPNIVERIQLGEALAYEELFTMPSEGALAQMFSDDMLAKPLDEWIDVYKTLAKDRTLTSREANAMNLAHWTMFPQTSRYGVHRHIPVKPLDGLDKSAPLPGIGSNTKWVPAAEGTADGALDSIRTGNTFLHTGDTLVPELPVPRLDIFRNDPDGIGQNVLNGAVHGNKDQRLMLFNIDEMDTNILTQYGDDYALLKSYANDVAYSKRIEPQYSAVIDDAAKASKGVEQGRPANHTSLYVPIIRTEIAESLVAVLQDPDITIEFAEFLAQKLATASQRRNLTNVPVGKLSDPDYTKMFADEIVDLLNPLNDPVGGGLGPEFYSTLSDDALEMMNLVDDAQGVYFPTMVMLTDPYIARIVSEAITDFSSMKQMGRTGIGFKEAPALKFARVDVHMDAFTGKTKMNLPEEGTVLGIPEGTEVAITDDLVTEILGLNRDIKPNTRYDPFAPNDHPQYRPPNVGVYGTSHRTDRIWPSTPWEGEGFTTRPVYGSNNLPSLNLRPVTDDSVDYIEIAILSGPDKGKRKVITEAERNIYLEAWPKVRNITADDFTTHILNPKDINPNTGEPWGIKRLGFNAGMLDDGVPRPLDQPIPIYINFEAILAWAQRRKIPGIQDTYTSAGTQALVDMGVDPNMLFAYLSDPSTKIFANQLSFADEFLELVNRWRKELYGDDIELLTKSSRLEDDLAEAAFIWEHEIAHARLNHPRKPRHREEGTGYLTAFEVNEIRPLKEEMANTMAIRKLGVPEESLSRNPEEILLVHPEDQNWVEMATFKGSGVTQDELIHHGGREQTDAAWNLMMKPKSKTVFEKNPGGIDQTIDTREAGDISWSIADTILDPNAARFNMLTRLDDMPWTAYGPQAMLAAESKWQNFVTWFFNGLASPMMNAIIREPLYLTNWADSFRTVQPFIRKQYRHSPSAYPELRKARGTIGNVFRIDEGKQVRSDQLQETIIHAMSQPETMADYLHVGLHEMTAKRAITNPTEPNYMKNLGIALIERDRAGVAKYLEPAIDQHVHKIFNPASFELVREGKVLEQFMLVVDDFMDWAWHELYLFDETYKVTTLNAIGATVPWIDDHTLRPVIQAHVQGAIPFWFAHEQFLRRMTRGLIQTPQMYRNMQVGIHVAGNVGLIREDSFGEKRLYMPVLPTVANLLHGLSDGVSNVAGDMTAPQVEAAMLWAGDVIFSPLEEPIGWNIKSMLPGYDPSKIHLPGAGPSISIPLAGLSTLIPEFAPMFEDLTYFRYGGSNSISENSAFANMVDTAVGVGFIKHVVPAILNQAGMTETPWGMADIGEAITAGAALMNMVGELPDEETYWANKEYYKEGIRNHARNILTMRALSWGFGTGVGQMAPLSDGFELRFSNEFQDMLDYSSRSGVWSWEDIYVELYERYINDAKAQYGTEYDEELRLEEWEKHAPAHRFQLFLTGKQTTTATGAMLPPTGISLEYINDNEQFLRDNTYAGSYLVPVAWAKEEDYAQLSAQRMVALDLRTRIPGQDLPEIWYLNADMQEYYMKFGEADKEILDLEYKRDGKGNHAGNNLSNYQYRELDLKIDMLKQKREAELEAYTNSHPVFKYNRGNKNSAESNRSRTLDEFKVLLITYDENPDLLPESEHRDDILEFARILVEHKEEMDDLKNRTGKPATLLRKQSRLEVVNKMDAFRKGKPWVHSLYYTVGRPLVGEDELLKIELDPYYGTN